jgi:hypothetical protein
VRCYWEQPWGTHWEPRSLMGTHWEHERNLLGTKGKKKWKILIFWMDFVAGNSNKLQKNCVWKEKSVETSMCSHYWIYKFSIMKMCKNKECVHTWVNGRGYASYVYSLTPKHDKRTNLVFVFSVYFWMLKPNWSSFQCISEFSHVFRRSRVGGTLLLVIDIKKLVSCISNETCASISCFKNLAL